MYPLHVVSSPTQPMPPLSPFSSDDDYEDLTPEGLETNMTMFSDPDTTHPPPTRMSVVVHEWMVDRLTTKLTTTEARIDELRL